MHLTTAEKNRVMNAAEYVAKHNTFTCCLLEGGFSCGRPFKAPMPRLRGKYTHFYVDDDALYFEWARGLAFNSRHERVMALLFFLEASE